MATQAHCAYCFEALSTNLEKRKPLTLEQVESFWEEYIAEDLPASANTQHDTSGKHTAVSRLMASSASSASASSSSVQSTASSIPSQSSNASSAATSASGNSFARKQENPGPSPLFVTWNTNTKSGELRLRGCIGTFQAQELDDGLKTYALTSALEDHRFPPILASELPTLSVGVTLLTDFEPISDPMDWTVGVHGLRISFTHNGRHFGSTYLPDVAREQGWGKEETMVSLLRKAGWDGRSRGWRDVADLSVVRYQGKVVHLGYGEWKRWRDWVGGRER